jgi:putative ABC transport system permease protein
MNPYRAIVLALRTLSRNRLRTCFMMLGMVVGISSLTALSSIGEGTRQETMRRFKRMIGTFDTIIVRPGSAQTRGMVSLTNVPPTLKFEDARAIATEVPDVRRVAQVQNAFDVDVKYRDQTAAPAIFGVSSNWTELRGDEISQGSGISDEDVQALGRVAVLGMEVKTTLFAADDPIGKTIRIADIPFQVKGVLSSRGAGPGGANLDNIVLIPVTTASRRLFNRDFLTMLVAQLKDPEQGDRAVGRITSLLRERHHIVPPASDDFTITNPGAAMARVTEVGSTLSKVLTGVAALATLIGGVVIMSLMLIAVSERRKEIGVRRSVGASQQDIVLQFLLEALTISALGGLIGIAIGAGGTSLATWWQQLPSALVWQAIASAVLISIAVGLLFGLHPAWKASRVDPIAALRS